MLLPPAALTRHAVCVGMTGSGKTGLCIALLEDLARAGVPILAVDPKGDLANLLLISPTLSPDDFRPWLDPAEAERLGLSLDALAERTATAWREGLAASGLGPDDLADFRARVDVSVLTPGSDAGQPVDVLATLTRAPRGLDDEGLRAWVTGAVTALLGLVERPADPLNDPEAILLARLFGDAFAAGEDLPLDVLLGRLVDPPFERLGYFPVDEVVPPKQRQALARALNNVVASPAFAAWRRGVPLDPAAWTAPVDGRTPLRVLYLAHLTDAERLFFVSLLAHAVLAWSRRLPGTGRLRALLYVDEVLGFLPPHPRDPPSKAPLLTLMKQARAVGVGVMLATQNPVDLDYKALSNAGTWMVGRLLTANDRERVLEGMLTGAEDRTALGARIAGLPPRHFVIRDVHGQVREVRSRHTMAYLRGPLTRLELDRLTDAPDLPEPEPEAELPGPPPLPPGLASRWVPGEAAERWTPWLWVRARVRFEPVLGEPERLVQRAVRLDVPEAPVQDVAFDRLVATPAPGRYPLLPPWADLRAEVDRLTARILDQVWRTEVAVRFDDGAGLVSRAGEPREAFAARAAEDAGRPVPIRTHTHHARREDVLLAEMYVLWCAKG